MRRLNLLVLFLGSFVSLLIVNGGSSPAPVGAERSLESLAPANFDCSQVSEIPAIECQALVALYNATDGPNWINNTNWLATNTPCNWHGIGCSNGVVLGLNVANVSGGIVSGNGLSGAIPPEIGNLVNLMSLRLYKNQITGVPPEIGNLVNLQFLDLYENQLTSIPSEIGNLTNLQTLRVNDNQITAIPATVGNLVNLTQLHLYNNQLTSLPPQIGNLTKLQQLWLFNNQISTVPATIGNLVNLQSLWLSNNQLISLPPEIGNLTKLQQLWLFTNQIPAVPSTIGNLVNLQTLDLRGNQITIVPPEVWNLGNLQSLLLGGNQLPSIPPEVSNLVNLQTLEFRDSQLTTIPPQVWNLVNLRSLWLSDNQLTTIPPEISNLVNLQSLDWKNNQLTAVPFQVWNLNLQSLSLGGNQLTAIPTEVSNLGSLQSLEFGNSQLTDIPPFIWSLTNLRSLDLRGNQLTTISPQIRNLINLQSLHLSDNQLVAMPPEVGILGNLQWLYLYNNPLYGELPQWLTSINLTTFFFDHTYWCIPNQPAIQTWLATRPFVTGTDLYCGDLTGVVSDHEGDALPNAQVLLYRHAEESSPVFVEGTQTNINGRYNFSGLAEGVNYYLYFQADDGGLAPEYSDNKKNLATADPINVTFGLTQTINAQLDIAHPPLVEVVMGSGPTTSTNPANGQVSIIIPNGLATDLTLSYTSTCAGAITAVVANYSSQLYPMTLGENGQYHVTIPANAVVASGDIVITTTCDGDDTTPTVGSIVLYDPSGIIADFYTGQPIFGAKVTLYQVPNWLPRTAPSDIRSNSCQSNLSKPAGQPWNQPAPRYLGVMVNTDQTVISPFVNIQYTNEIGYYGWDIPQGCWFVVVEAEGYLTRTSSVVGFPPEVLDLNLALFDKSVMTNHIYLPVVSR